MPRPVKWRRVEFIPRNRYFVPSSDSEEIPEEIVLQIEEVEALRLKDLEGLEQEACAEKMEVSRQTFQRVLNSARGKVADAIINGKAIRIAGGNYTRHICQVRCRECGRDWKESFEKYEEILQGNYHCTYCGSPGVECQAGPGRGFCRKNCRRHGRADTP